MSERDIAEAIFGANGERMEWAINLPHLHNGMIANAYAAYEGVRHESWGEMMDLAQAIQRDEGWAYVYIIKGTHGGVERMKIGKANDMHDRLKLFNVKIPFDIETVASFYVPGALQLERMMHVMMDGKRISGEWFDLSESDLKKLKLVGLGAELKGWAMVMDRIVSAYRESNSLPDADYIAYLELLLAMNNIPFQRNGTLNHD